MIKKCPKTVNRFIVILVTLVLVASFLVGCTSTPPTTTTPPTGQTTTPAPTVKSFNLRIQSGVPRGSLEYEIPVGNFFANIERMSGGTLKGKYYANPEILPAADMWASMSAGSLDMTFGGETYYAAKVPEGKGVADFPFVFNSAFDAREIYVKTLPIMQAAYAPQGITYLGAAYGGGVGLWLKKPITRLSELKGLKIRHYGAFASVLQDVGASVVFIAHPDVYTALATGTIDGSGTTISFYQDLKYYELAPNLIMPFMSYSIGQGLAINTNTWNQMSKEQQEIMKIAGEALYAEYAWKQEMKNNEILGKAAAGTYGPAVKIITLPTEDVNTLVASGMKFLDKWGTDNASNTRIQQYIQIIKDYLKAQGRIK